jgi:hypothetical protein
MTDLSTLIALAASEADDLTSVIRDLKALADASEPVPVPPGTDLRAVLQQASARDRPLVLDLTPGATYAVGADYQVPAKPAALSITLRTDPERAPAVLVGEWRHPTATVGNYHFENVRLEGLPQRPDRTLVQHGTTTATLVAAQPSDFSYVRVLFDGTATGYRRGLLAHSRRGVLAHCTFRNFSHTGQDAQAVCAYNGSQDWLVRDTYLEASTEVVLLGGGTAMAPEMVPTRWAFTRCRFHKPRVWQSLEKRTAKNIVELKAGVDIRFGDCTLEGSWTGAQNGAGIVLKACHSGEKNPDGTPGNWVRTEDIVIERCLVSHVGVGLVLVGKNEGGPTQPMRRVTVTDTLFFDIGKDDGIGVALRVADGPETVSLINVGFDNAGNFCDVWPASESGVCRGWRLSGVAGRTGPYGFKGEATAAGQPTLDRYFPGLALDGSSVFAGTTIPGASAVDEAGLQTRLRALLGRASTFRE